MAGILDNKSRIMDTVLTTDGRRQLANGSLRFSFFSFTDRNAFYAGDVLSGSANTSNRIHLEAAPSGRDQITFETDEGGAIIPMVGLNGNLTILGGRLYANGILITGPAVSGTLERIMSSSLDNLRSMMIIGSADRLEEEHDFEIDKDLLTFTITKDLPLAVGKDVTSAAIEDAESFFHDRRFSHVKNFQYMPPINKNSGKKLGLFPAQGQKRILGFEQITKSLRTKEQQIITFSKTSRDSNVISQIFEVSNDKISKLDVIDFGDFNTATGVKQVYFVGKVFIDADGNGTFVNIFTVIFE